MKKSKKKGFTLIEMLVVIAIIAVLVAIIIPTVSNATKKAKAATDAANLRSVLGQANVILLEKGPNPASISAGMAVKFDCKSVPGAKAYLAYTEPGFMAPYFVNGSDYYSLEYFSDIAAKGETSRGKDQPSGYDTWYPVGGSE